MMSNLYLKESQGTKHLIYEILDSGLIDELSHLLIMERNSSLYTPKRCTQMVHYIQEHLSLALSKRG
jgi:hypothetical protein